MVMTTTQEFKMNEKKVFMGFDPGSKGAVAIIDEYDNVLLLEDLDKELGTYWYLAIFLGTNDWTRTYHVAVEDVCGRPGQSCQANTTFMKLAGYAELTGYIFAKTPEHFHKVKPQVWKKYFGLISKDLTKTEKKHLSIDLAKKLFPSVEGKLSASKDGRAEALLIARYIKDVVSGRVNS